jgi:hypothetical protein
VNTNDELDRALADLAERADSSQPADRLDRIHRRARRANRSRAVAASVAAVLVVAGSAALVAKIHAGPSTTVTGTQPTASSSTVQTPSPHSTTATASAVPSSSQANAGAQPCSTSGLTVSLGQTQATAGSTYTPIVFTNRSNHSCTMYGFPGVSFAAPTTGRQVGAPAGRQPLTPATLTLAPGAQASALLQIVDPGVYSPAQCKPVSVSGLRIYPPANTAAVFLPPTVSGRLFMNGSLVCSTQVAQLTIRPVVAGTTGL